MRVEEVYARLQQVYDPELDRPVTDLGFISGVDVDGPVVRVRFRLPTYWCSPNFAYIMAEDIRDRVRELPWVSEVQVRLEDHFAADEVNAGVATGRPFGAAFSGLADGNLEDLRWLFRLKAFLARQERLVRLLIRRGLSDDEIVAMCVADLRRLAESDAEAGDLVDRYLGICREMGLEDLPTAPAFTRENGLLLNPAQLRDVLREARRTRISMEFNAQFCQGLLRTRYGSAEPETVQPR
ncbi:iron-sulfur cluster assembly protein [Caldinitratiruptor microaerophilus]|uniref:MIP18 family-like domain-containing protein n=1 Tax=Caldinitratiruptor microaerophilus TaxID=671077 RepID=A0AA35CLA5_9FIRM|nr:iron-sulfur cluster assembly protein [Caldinitratiruptor microaerophilus]BDG60508.1 hypothetical protein caldi_15980 [Caldinitratiruptor microaerophilus]